MAELPKPEEIKGLVSLLAPGVLIMTLRARVSGGPVAELPERLITYGFVSAAYFAGATPLFNVVHGVPLPLWLVQFLEYFGLPLILGIALFPMSQSPTDRRSIAMDSHRPARVTPRKITGGYQPPTSQHGPPPTGGSGAELPKK